MRKKRVLSKEEKRKLKNMNNRLYKIRKKWKQIGENDFIPIRGVREFSNLPKSALNKYLKESEKFLKSDESKLHKNEYGFIYSEKDRKEFNMLLEKRNERKRKQWEKLKDVPLQGYGEDIVTPMDITEMQRNNKYHSFMPRHLKIEGIKNQKELDKIKEKLKKEGVRSYDEILANRLKKNLIQSIKTTDADKGADLIKQIEGLSLKKFMDLYWTSDIVTPAFIYHDDDNPIKSFAQLSRLIENSTKRRKNKK